MKTSKNESVLYFSCLTWFFFFLNTFQKGLNYWLLFASFLWWPSLCYRISAPLKCIYWSYATLLKCILLFPKESIFLDFCFHDCQEQSSSVTLKNYQIKNVNVFRVKYVDLCQKDIEVDLKKKYFCNERGNKVIVYYAHGFLSKSKNEKEEITFIEL